MDKKRMNYINDFKRNKYKRISFEIDINYYNDILKPAADHAGIGVNTLIKQAIKEFLRKDQG